MRNLYVITAVLAILSISLTELPGQTPALKVPNRPDSTDPPQKFENGLQIFWRNGDFFVDKTRSASAPDSTIEVFDPSRNSVASFNLTKVIRKIDPGLADVSVYDVSARSPGYIAVSAVFERTEGTPVALLLYFGWDGSLTGMRVLDPLPEIDKLEIDSSGHLWALNDFDSDNPTAFVFTEFDSSGSIVNRFVRPARTWSTQESMSTGGEVSFGLIPTGAWAWLPKSRTLISVDRATGRATIHNTGLPLINSRSKLNARKTVLLHDGQLLLDASWRMGPKLESRWLLWKADSGWKNVRTSRSGSFPDLYGIDGNELISLSTAQSSWPPEFHAERADILLSTGVEQ